MSDIANNRYRLLIVDDEYQIRKGLSKLVNWSSIDVMVVGVASSGREALEMIRNLAPDLVISDICMDNMNGLDLVKESSFFNPDLRFIFISGYDDFEYARRAIELGVCRYVLKPIVPEEILDIVSQVLVDIEKKRLKNDSRIPIALSAEKRLDATSNKDDDNFLITKACHLIGEHYSESDFSQSQVASMLGIHPSYLSRLFHKLKEISFNKYVYEIRINEAKKLLTETTMRVSSVGKCVGINDSRYFSTLFKKHVGITPKEFRSKVYNEGER